MKVIKVIFFVTFLLVFNSCSNKNKTIEKKDVLIHDYSVEITFSSFWDCGVFKKYILNNLKNEDPRIKATFKDDIFYTINQKGNCKPPIQVDTTIIILLKNQSDSIFDLANGFIDNFKLQNRVKPLQRINVVSDGANVEVKIRLLNRCKSATYYHYNHLNDISKEMDALIKYIDSVRGKKQFAAHNVPSA